MIVIARAAAAAIIVALLLSGCATSPPQIVERYIGCPAAQVLPEQPPLHVRTDPANPGQVVREAEINRKEWIRHAQQLTTKIKACQ